MALLFMEEHVQSSIYICKRIDSDVVKTHYEKTKGSTEAGRRNLT